MLLNDKVVELMQFMLFHAYYKTAGKPKKGKSKVSDRLLKSPLEEPKDLLAACSTRFLAMLNSNVRRSVRTRIRIRTMPPRLSIF